MSDEVFFGENLQEDIGDTFQEDKDSKMSGMNSSDGGSGLTTTSHKFKKKTMSKSQQKRLKIQRGESINIVENTPEIDIDEELKQMELDNEPIEAEIEIKKSIEENRHLSVHGPADKNDIRCMACKRWSSELGYGPDKPVETANTYSMGRFICEECWEAAGYPMGSGDELIERILLILGKPTLAEAPDA